MRAAATLTTTEAAQVAAVAPSTIKRWADQGVLPYSRTAGGHRRFERLAVERLVRPASGLARDPLAADWVHCLVEGQRHELDGRLLEARARLGSWWRVADELAAALVELGVQWQCGQLTVAQEHMASDALTRSLARVGDALPTRVEGPRCLLACAGDDEHTLGLSLAELCLREAGILPLWLGRRTPVAEVVRMVSERRVSMVALSASALLDDERALRAITDEVGAACREHDVALLLGGRGAWPAEPSFGARIASFAELHASLTASGH
jgi:excisionase family DNA binding protein